MKNLMRISLFFSLQLLRQVVVRFRLGTKTWQIRAASTNIPQSLWKLRENCGSMMSISPKLTLIAGWQEITTWNGIERRLKKVGPRLIHRLTPSEFFKVVKCQILRDAFVNQRQILLTSAISLKFSTGITATLVEGIGAETRTWLHDFIPIGELEGFFQVQKYQEGSNKQFTGFYCSP